MESVITRVVVNEGAGPAWEAAMGERMTAAESSLGWIGGSILAPEEDRNARVILGLWENRAAWEQWHRDPAFRETAERLTELESDPGTPNWNTVVYAGGQLRE
jgi:heme-degrading monooxygenase HmoA